MANSRKKKSEPPPKETSPKIISGENIDINELFARLKEFENKALLDRLKSIERSISSIQKGMLVDRATLKDVKQIVSYLSLAHEELLNQIGFGEPTEEEIEKSVVVEKGGKKWN